MSLRRLKTNKNYQSRKITKKIQPKQPQTALIMFRNAVASYASGCVMLCRTNDKHLTPVGTAFICHKKGYLLTAAHTFSLTDTLCFIAPRDVNSFNASLSTNLTAFTLTVAQYDAANDVALLKADPGLILSAPTNIFGNESITPVGASVCYLGYPHAHNGQHSLKVSGTTLSSKVISSSGTNQFIVDSMAESCNSGGPLIDVANNLIIGIMSGRFSPTGTGSAIRIGNHALGTESTLSYASTINYGLALLKAEGLDD